MVQQHPISAVTIQEYTCTYCFLTHLGSSLRKDSKLTLRFTRMFILPERFSCFFNAIGATALHNLRDIFIFNLVIWVTLSYLSYEYTSLFNEEAKLFKNFFQFCVC